MTTTPRRPDCRRRIYAVSLYYLPAQAQVQFHRSPARVGNGRRVWEPGPASLGRLCRTIGRIA